MYNRLFFGTLLCGLLAGTVGCSAESADVAAAAANRPVVVAGGGEVLPLVVAADAPEATVEAVETLAGYLARITGVRPEVIVGSAAGVPEKGIWVGPQAGLANAFPGVDLNFAAAEEILIVAAGDSVAIVGRDRVIDSVQTEHGTANAVYTFIGDQLGVRWLWPGELGEDVPRMDMIELEPFELRFAPPFRQRAMARPWRGHFSRDWNNRFEDWYRFQRGALHSLRMGTGHAFTHWWDRFHEDHPDYFALQPDGTRQAHPRGARAKLCEANPAVWQQWLDDAAAQLAVDPGRVISAAQNDGTRSGPCVCADCRAWDHPDGDRETHYYADGHREQHVVLTDRGVTFWNHLARGLRERYPERDDVYVGGWAYSTYRTPPIGVVADDNVVIGYVGHFPLAADTTAATEKERILEWTDKVSKMVFRPNLFHYSGGMIGLPSQATARTARDYRFLADSGVVGLNIDSWPGYYATQAPQLYLMMQLAYDPWQDAGELMSDFYRRGFGPAATEVERYFNLLEEAHEMILDHEDFRNSSGWAANDAPNIYLQVYTPEFLAECGQALAAAARQVADGPAVYRQRVDFVQTGLDYTKLLMETMAVMKAVKESEGADLAAVERGLELVRAREELFAANEERMAFCPHRFRGWQPRMVDWLGESGEK